MWFLVSVKKHGKHSFEVTWHNMAYSFTISFFYKYELTIQWEKVLYSKYTNHQAQLNVLYFYTTGSTCVCLHQQFHVSNVSNALGQDIKHWKLLCQKVIGIFQFHYALLRTPSYMWSIVIYMILCYVTTHFNHSITEAYYILYVLTVNALFIWRVQSRKRKKSQSYNFTNTN